MKPLAKAALCCSTAFVFLLILSGCDLFNVSVPQYLEKYTTGVMAAAPTFKTSHFVPAPIDPAGIMAIEPAAFADGPAVMEVRLMNAAQHPLILTLYSQSDGGVLAPISPGTAMPVMADFRTIHIELYHMSLGETLRFYLDIETDDETRRKFDPVTDFPLIVCNDPPESPMELTVANPAAAGGPPKAVWEMNASNEYELVLQFQKGTNANPERTKEYLYRYDENDLAWKCDDDNLELGQTVPGSIPGYTKFTGEFPMNIGDTDLSMFDFRVTLRDPYGFEKTAATAGFGLEQSPLVVINKNENAADLELGTVPVTLTAQKNGISADRIRYRINGGQVFIYSGQFQVSIGDEITAWSEKSGYIDSARITGSILLERFVYVKPGGAGDGSSWASALGDVQAAIEYTYTTAGKTHVLIQEGTYTPSSAPNIANTGGDTRMYHFALRNGVTVIGGFAGSETNIFPAGTNPTILSGGTVTSGTPGASNLYHVFYHPDTGDTSTRLNSTAVLTNVIIQGGSAAGGVDHNLGGGMYNKNNDPLLVECHFRWNSTSTYGGGMYNHSSSPVITECIFEENSSDSDGGAIFNDVSTVTVSGTGFIRNKANNSGGAIFSRYGSIKISNCAFETNTTAAYSGGAIVNKNLNGVITGSQFMNNTAKAYGGGMYNELSTVTVTDCLFSNNTADSYYGGGMFNTTSKAKITDTNFAGNNARRGGGIYNEINSVPEIIHCSFSGNTAADEGGGLYNDTSNLTGTFIIDDSTFISNIAVSVANGNGGAIYNAAKNTIITDSVFLTNSSGMVTEGGGGGIYNAGKNLSVTQCSFLQNISSNGGGGIYNIGESTILEECVFSSNETTLYGGGLFNQAPGLTVLDCAFTENKTTAGSYGSGGAVHNLLLENGSAVISGSTFDSNESRNGGAVYNSSKDVSIENCTFYTNHSRSNGGAVYNTSSLDVISCTFYGNTAVSNGGGFYLQSNTTVLQGSILAGNTAASSNEYYGSFDASSGSNLITGENGFTGTAEDIFVSSGGVPVLDDYRGPAKTIMIKKDGPAHNKITAFNSWLPSRDQRGIARPQDGAADIGAVEWTGGDPE